MFAEICPVQLELQQINVNDSIIPIVVEVDAADYNPYLCCDGGSYARESLDISFSTSDGRHAQLFLDDSSCGDFGTRFYASLCVGGEQVASARFGSMLRCDEQFSDFSFQREADIIALNAAFITANIFIPGSEDLAAEEE